MRLCSWSIQQELFKPVENFNYGPVEWLWRSLTYWKLQPFKR
ncbi:DUF418 domain-containing protein [Runella aurantiaca]|uniref:DUF418 domain-containing protein n=1 Tax=Runella aurantiaca TaxID=2282308 RepID=A0A369ILG1_9BACT|nr:DUF418 domain-containing protein [Runella aurantiaca]